MSLPTKLAALVLLCLCGAICAQTWQPTWPAPPVSDMSLTVHSRLCFGVSEKNLEQVIKDGANVICGGTNAAGIGFAGGPFILGKNGEIIDIFTGEPIPEKTLREIQSRVALARQRGALVLGEVIRMHMTPWLQAEHPEWQVVNSPGEKPMSVEEMKKRRPLGCWNSGYGDFFINSQVAIAKRLGWDGYNMDGFGCWQHCFCPACRESYKKDSGREIPATTDVNNSEFRHYLKWRLDRFTKFVVKWNSALNIGVKGDFMTAPWSTGPGRWWHWMGAPGAEGSDAMHRVLHVPCVELLWDFPPDQGSNLLPAFTCRYYRGLCGDRPAWMLPYLCEQGQFNAQPPLAECEVREMTVITNGCIVAQGLWQQSEKVTLGRLNKMIADREEFTRDARSVKWAAMLVGESSRLLYGLPGKRLEVPMGAWMGSGVDTKDIGNAPPGERRMPAHMESAVGVFRAMMEDHLPLDIVTEQDVEDGRVLSQYKVLILPNAGCLRDKAAAVIAEFVKKGGGLVAMHETSICDEFGDRRKDFALGPLMGVKYLGSEDFSARWPNYPKTTEIYLGIKKPDLHEIWDDEVVRSNYRLGSDRLQYIGWMSNVEVLDGAKKLGRRLATPKEWPLMVANSVAEGRSIYFAADIGQAYFTAPYQYQRKLISNSVRWAAGKNAAPFEIDAPLCVQCAFYTQIDGQRKVVHLLNEVNTSANRAIPENNPSQREEMIPIADIKVRAKMQNPMGVFLEPGHRALEMKKSGQWVEVSVPRLDVHAMVVFEEAR